MDAIPVQLIQSRTYISYLPKRSLLIPSPPELAEMEEADCEGGNVRNALRGRNRIPEIDGHGSALA